MPRPTLSPGSPPTITVTSSNVNNKNRPATPEVSPAPSAQNLVPRKDAPKGKVTPAPLAQKTLPQKGIAKEKVLSKPDKKVKVEASLEDFTSGTKGGPFKKEKICPAGFSCTLDPESESESEKPSEQKERGRSTSPKLTKLAEKKFGGKSLESSRKEQRPVSTPESSTKSKRPSSPLKTTSKETRSQSPKVLSSKETYSKAIPPKNPPASVPKSQNPPASVPKSQNPPASVPKSKNPPASVPKSNNPPTSVPDSGPKPKSELPSKEASKIPKLANAKDKFLKPVAKADRSPSPKYSKPNPTDYENDSFTNSTQSLSKEIRAERSTGKPVNSKARSASSPPASKVPFGTPASISKEGAESGQNTASKRLPFSKADSKTADSKSKRRSQSKTKMPFSDTEENFGSDSEAKMNRTASNKKSNSRNRPNRSKPKSGQELQHQLNPTYDGEADDENDESSLGVQSAIRQNEEDDSDQGLLSQQNVQKYLLANPVFLNTFVEENVDGGTLHQWVQQKCCASSEQAKAYKDAKLKYKAEKRGSKGHRGSEGANENDEGRTGQENENDEADEASDPENHQALNFKLDQIPGCPSQGVPREMTPAEIRRFKTMYGIDLRGGASSRNCSGGAYVGHARVEIPSCSPQRPSVSVRCPAFKQYQQAQGQQAQQAKACNCPKCRKKRC